MCSTPIAPSMRTCGCWVFWERRLRRTMRSWALLGRAVRLACHCRVEHWRAQPKVGSFRSPLFRLRSGFLVRPSLTFPAAPPKIPYGGFSPVRLQAQAPRSSVCRLPSPRSALKSDPRHPCGTPCVCCSLGTSDRHPGCPPLSADLWPCSFHLSPEVLAPAGLYCPCLRRLATSSASLETSVSFPSFAGYSGSLWHSRTLLPGLHTFRTFTTVLSRIAAYSIRRESRTCTPPILPSQHWPSGRGNTPLATPIFPPISFTWGPNFDGSFVRFRCGPPGCLPPGLIRPGALPSPPEACTSGLSALKSPRSLPDMTTVPNGELRRQDFHL